jgi:hypothetical protein
LAHAELSDEFADRSLGRPEELQELSPVGLGQNLEDRCHHG